MTTRTTLLLLRLRHHIVQVRRGSQDPLLAEECITTGFRGAPDAAQWLATDEVDRLLKAEPGGNLSPQQAGSFVQQVVDGYAHLRGRLDSLAQERAEALLAAHTRVRKASQATGVRYRVEPHLPVDVLGIYVLLPVVQ